jgi:hypothetical protein
MQLVDQAVVEQIVPEDVAAEHQDVAPRAALQRPDLVVGVGPADDAGGRPVAARSGVRVSETTS